MALLNGACRITSYCTGTVLLSTYSPPLSPTVVTLLFCAVRASGYWVVLYVPDEISFSRDPCSGSWRHIFWELRITKWFLAEKLRGIMRQSLNGEVLMFR